jgi:histone deacetylase 1/2
MVTLVIIAIYAYGARADDYSGEPSIEASSYFNSTTNEKIGYEWVSDSGTNRFVTNDPNNWVDGTYKAIPTTVAVGGGKYISPGYGDKIVQSTDLNITIMCRDVLLMPKCAKNLMPTSAFVKKGCTIIFGNYDKVNVTASDGTPILSGREIDGLYLYKCQTLDPSTIKLTCAHDTTQDTCTDQVSTGNNKGDKSELRSSELCSTSESFFGLPVGKNSTGKGNSPWDFPTKLLESHWAYGHLHFDKLRKLMGLGKGDNPECPPCTMAMSRKAALSKKMPNRATHSNYRMHIDLGFTRGSKFVFQLCIEDYTRKGYLDVLDEKSECFDSWQKLRTHLENKFAPWKFAFVRTDGESVYTTERWITYYEESGVVHEVSGRYRHDQNGVVERPMQSIGVPFRIMMIQGCAPEEDIPDCLRHANIIRNNSPTKANNGWTPNEKEAGMRLPINKRLLRGPLFCLVFAHVYEQERRKHEPRGVACVYLGYDDINNTYKVKEWATGVRYFTADLTFHPKTFPYRANPSRTPEWLTEFQDMAPHAITPEFSPNHTVADPHATALQLRRSSRQNGYQYSGGQELRNMPDVDAPPNDNTMMLTEMDFSNYMIHSFGPDPKSWDEALRSKYANEWIEADLAERNAFARHEVLTLVPRSEIPKDKKIFNPKRVMKININPPCEEHPTGSIDKFKVRMTIAAFTRMLTQGIDYVEKHASTVRWNSIKMLIAIAVRFNLDIVLYDIASFFLYGNLTDEVYMEQPPGWELEDKPKEEYVYQLNRGMYGLPQAGHCAQEKLNKTLTAKDKFRATTADDCVYVGQTPESYAVLGAHVDDILAVGDEPGLAATKEVLSGTFKITEKRNPTVVTGVQIERNRDAGWLKLHQTAYVKALLEEYNMTDCKHASTPLDPGMARAMMLLPTTPEDRSAQKDFQKLVGKYIWLPGHTRPDFLFCVNFFCRFLKNATRAHYDLARGRPLRYLSGTVDYGLVFQAGSGEWVLSGAADSDLAGDIITSRSTSGFYAKLGEYGAVVCGSSLERKISTSTGQAETYSMQSMVKEVVWDRHLLRELRCPQVEPTVIETDNDGVFKQSTKAINHASAKHYRIAQAYIRSKVADQTVKVISVDTDKNPADFFTKPLGTSAYERHRSAIMGPQQRPPSSV